MSSCEEGDLILLSNMGAYGADLGSLYNLHLPADKLFME